MNQPVRKRTDADATETNQLDVTGIFCGKLLSCPAMIRASGTKAKMRDPSGGTAGRVKPYGRLGWMGACAEYSLDGEGFCRSHIYWSRKVAERSNGLQIFYCAAGRLASRTAALSEAMAEPGCFKSLVMGTS